MRNFDYNARCYFPSDDVMSFKGRKMLEEKSLYYLKALQNQIDILQDSQFDAIELNKKRDEYWEALRIHVDEFVTSKPNWFDPTIFYESLPNANKTDIY